MLENVCSNRLPGLFRLAFAGEHIFKQIAMFAYNRLIGVGERFFNQQLLACSSKLVMENVCSSRQLLGFFRITCVGERIIKTKHIAKLSG